MAGNMTSREERGRSLRVTAPAGAACTFGRAFTLLELMFVVAIVGLLAAIVVPHFTNASGQAEDSSVRRHLQIIRNQIAYYRTQYNRSPDLLGTQWDDLVTNNFLHTIPVNPYNGSTVISDTAGFGVGWVWRDNGFGVQNMYATGATWAEFVE